MHENGKLSLFGFTSGFSVFLVILGLHQCDVNFDKEFGTLQGELIIAIAFALFITLFILILAKGNLYNDPLKDSSSLLSVLSQSSLLGWSFAIGCILIKNNNAWQSPFGIYICVLTFFHYSEFLTISIFNPETLGDDSFLLEGTSYAIAALSSWIEYGVESYFFPQYKGYKFLTVLGLSMCVFGELVRKIAMITAHKNFTHRVRQSKVDGHELITSGLYKFVRHPSYCGWFWWSIGTQVLLGNPICAIGYAIVSWNFFLRRITYEEATLFSFFGQNYANYKNKVTWSGVPLVIGYKISE